MYKAPSSRVLSQIAAALSLPTAELYREAGMEHLLVEADPQLEPLLDSFAVKLESLPRRDREIISSEIRRILLEEKEKGEGVA